MTAIAVEGKPVLKFDVTFERVVKKHLPKDALRSQLQFIAGSAKRNRAANWVTHIPTKHIHIIPFKEEGPGGEEKLRYTAVIQLEKRRYNSADAVQAKFDKACKVMARAANRKGWHLMGEGALVPVSGGDMVVAEPEAPVNGQPRPAPPPRRIRPSFSGLELPPLTDEVLARYFARIYDREAHIRIIYDNLALAVKTGFRTRHHLLLHGKPACAKTEILLCFIDWLGEGLIMPVDASTMTKAGLERELLNASMERRLRPILIVEEIEKCADENTSCLIQVMDSRGKIQRTNARDGDISADCKIIVWATCNDESALKKFHDGAIWSRFSVKQECHRPDEALMRRILLRECEEIDGDPAWVDVVIPFLYTELVKHPKFKDDYDDPRLGRSLLAGGARLLDDGPKGYLADYRKVSGITK